MFQIVIVDSQPDRASLIQARFRDNSTTVQSADSLHDAVQAVGTDTSLYIILAHCDFLNDSFTSMAKLRKNPRVKILFYSTDSKEKLRATPLVPDELHLLVEKVQDLCASQAQ